MNRIAPAQADSLRSLYAATAGAVRSDAPDLSLRQLAVLLTITLEPGPHTVRGMAAALNISKPAVTRALDRLEGLRFRLLLARRHALRRGRGGAAAETVRDGTAPIVPAAEADYRRLEVRHEEFPPRNARRRARRTRVKRSPLGQRFGPEDYRDFRGTKTGTSVADTARSDAPIRQQSPSPRRSP